MDHLKSYIWALRPVAGDNVPQAAQYRSLFTPAAPSLGSSGDDAASHAAQRQGLQPYSSRTTQRCKKETFAAEQRGFDFTHVFNVVIDHGLKRNQTARIDTKEFAGRKSPFDQHAACMYKGPAIALQPFHDESF